ncbi:MAG: hypothetical protein LQ346_008380 [Caloplaca aetnensis]|nr:MAG: hypothetical protein LQ346_008380 [Caloplaca aetnensis]
MTATTTVTIPGPSLGPGLLTSLDGPSQTALPEAPVRSATATMTPSSHLITTAAILQTPFLATEIGPSTASKPDEMGIGPQNDHSEPKAGASPPPASGNVLTPNLASQLSSAPAAPQRPPETSMTGTSGTAINNAGLENQEPVSKPVVVGYTPSGPNQAPEGPGPTLSSAVQPATTAPKPASPPLSSEPQSIASFGRLTTAGSASQYIIGTHTLTPGAPGITIDGTVVSLQPSATAVVVGSSTMPLAPPPGQEIVAANGLSFLRGPGSNLVLGTQTITPGAPAVSMSGTPVSLADDGTAIAIGSSTALLPAAAMQGFVGADAFTFSRGSDSDLVIGTQTITPGAPAVTISGTPVSLPVSGTAVVVDGSIIPFLGPTPAPTTAPATLDINGMPLTALSGSRYIIGSQTLIPGKPAVTVYGTPVSLAVGGTAIVAGDSTIPLSTATAAPAVLGLNGMSFTALPGSNYVIGSQTLVPGKPAITVSGTPVLLAASATAVVVGGSTIPLSGATTTPAVLAINGNTYTAISGSIYLIDSQTLVPGGPAITVSGTPISLPLGATAVVIGGSTVPVRGPTSTPAVLTINDNPYTAMSNSDFLIGSQTLVPGGPATTVSGTPISLPLDATAVVIGDSTLPIPSPTTTPAVLELNGQSYTQQISGSGFLIGTQTLVPGGAGITVNGTLVSLGADATNLVVGTQTEPLTTSSSRGLGEVIMGGFGSGGLGGPVATR